MQEALSFEIYDGDKLLFCGTAEEWTKEASCVSDTPLAAGETRRLTAVVRMEETAGNLYQGGDITFDMTADAVQSKNNPDKSFE